MLIGKNLKYSYSEQSEIQFPDFELNQGEALCLLGPSGKGKSTLLHLLSGLLPLQSGEVTLNGANFSQLSSKELNALRAESISVILQETQFVDVLSFQENIALAIKKSKQSEMDFALQLAADLGVDHLLDKKPNKFSGGEKQRAALVVAMAKKPALLLADEPTANLDDENAEKVAEVLVGCCRTYNSALLVVTHDARLKKHFKTTLLL
jgi:putative ABC transport system ATP-binding protein